MIIGLDRKGVQDRFWQKVKVSGIDECWEWMASVRGAGYGRFRMNNPRRTVSAHRISYQLAHGEIPEGMSVCHSCDNPKCVNPAHLWIGTTADNMTDRDKKGRTSLPKGEINGQAKLTVEQIKEIRELYKIGEFTQKKLGKEYGIGQDAISRIITGKRWSHVK